MKKILLTTMVLGSTIAISACSTGLTTSDALDETLTQAPYAEERTVGSVPSAVVRSASGAVSNAASGAVSNASAGANGSAPAVRSAEPVFQSYQVK